MEYVTIRFVTASDWISWMIRLQTWSAFSHVEFILDDGTTLGAHADGGVAIRPINYATFTREERYRIPVTAEQKAKILAYAHAQVGKPYDYLDIAGILFHRDWRLPNRWICSELVAAAFEVGGVPLLHAPFNMVNRISPGGLYQSPRLIGCFTAEWAVDALFAC